MDFLPAESLQPVYGVNLSPGDFAFFSDANKSPLLVGTSQDSTTRAVWLTADPAHPTFNDVEELDGTAQRVADTTIEADPASGYSTADISPAVGDIIFHGKEISVVARGAAMHSRVWVRVADRTAGENPVTFAYRKWRIVKRVGEKAVTLFERAQPEVKSS